MRGGGFWGRMGLEPEKAYVPKPEAYESEEDSSDD